MLKRMLRCCFVIHKEDYEYLDTMRWFLVRRFGDAIFLDFESGEPYLIAAAYSWDSNSIIFGILNDSCIRRMSALHYAVYIVLFNKPDVQALIMPSGAGKSFWAQKKGNFIDGDEIIRFSIGWPYKKEWYLTDPPYVTSEGFNFNTVKDFWSAASRAILKWLNVNPGFIALFVIPIAGVKSKAYLLSFEQHVMNMQERRKAGVTTQPVLFGKQLKDLRNDWLRMIRNEKIGLISSFEEYFIPDFWYSSGAIFFDQLLDVSFISSLFGRCCFSGLLNQIADFQKRESFYASMFTLSLPNVEFDLGSNAYKQSLFFRFNRRIIGLNLLKKSLVDYQMLSDCSVNSKFRYGSGQDKLFFADLAAILSSWQRFDVIYYYGSAPGYHINKLLFLADRWILIDPRETAVSGDTVTVVNDVLNIENAVKVNEKGKVLIIMDVRRDPDGSNWEDLVLEDTLLMIGCAKIFVSKGYYVAFKFRFSYIENFKALSGSYYPYSIPFLPMTSYEVRIESPSKNICFSTQQLAGMRSYKSLVGDRAIADGIFSRNILQVDFRAADFSNAVAFYCLSNVKNLKWDFLTFSLKLLAFNLPSCRLSLNTDYHYDMTAVSFLLRSQFIGCDIFDIINFTKEKMSFKQPLIFQFAGIASCDTVWMFFISKSLIPYDVSGQHFMFAPNRFVRRSLCLLRKKGISANQDYAFRKVWLNWYGVKFSSVTPVSGHLLHLLIDSAFHDVDLNFYLDTIFYISKFGSTIDSFEVRGDWHQPTHWYYAVLMYPYFCRFFDIKFNFLAWVVCIRRLSFNWPYLFKVECE